MTTKQTVKSMMFRQSEVDYTTVSPETGSRQCANCRWFCASHMEYNDEGGYLAESSCKIIEPYPLAILPTGMCNRHELMPTDANEPEPMEVIIVEEDGEDMEMAYASPNPVKAAAWRRIIGQPNPPSMFIWKDADGLRRMLIVTSNGYEDRENEHVAQRALLGYVKESYKGDEYIGGNKLLFYHKGTLDIGDIVSADVIDGFLVELAKERGDSPVATRIWDYVETTAQDKSVQWGASHGFRAVKRGNTYVRIRKKETTVLDIQDAANWYTFAGVLNE